MSDLRDILASEGLNKNANLVVREFEGEEGNQGHLTRIEEGEVRLLNIMRLKDSLGEKREWQRRGDQWFFGNYTEADWKAFLEDIRVNGIREPIFITKDWGVRKLLSARGTTGSRLPSNSAFAKCPSRSATLSVRAW